MSKICEYREAHIKALMGILFGLWPFDAVDALKDKMRVGNE